MKTAAKTFVLLFSLLFFGVNLAKADPAVNPGGTPFVTGQTLTTLRNDVTGLFGFKFTVGASPITVTELGRWVVAGNTQAHTLKLVVKRKNERTDVPGGSVSIATAGAPAGAFKYAALAAPVTLAARTTYFLLSDETKGGDQFYGGGTTLTHTSAAVIKCAIFYTDVHSWNSTASTGSHGPVSFKTAP